MNALPKRAAPVAAAGGRLRVKPANPAFTDAVLADVLRISKTSAGRALFRRVRDAGRVVTVERPEPPTEPPNAWTLPRDPDDRSATEMVIVYDPADWPVPAPLGSLPSDVVLFGRLEDAVGRPPGAEDPQSEPAVSRAMDAYLRERNTTPEPPARTQP